MKIAVFHNFMDNIGGAEMVALTLARGLYADVYTTNIDEEKITKMGFGDVLPRIHSLGRIPVNAPFRHQLALWKFRRLNLGKQYDFYIIAGDWAMSGAVNNKPNLWYVHSPLNELWHWKDYVRQELLNWWKRPLFDAWVWWNRRLSLRYAKHVGVWVCNSQNSKERIKKYYGKEATIIYPPIATGEYAYKPYKNYWLSVNRLLKHKRVDLQVKAFAQLPNEKLIIVGSYEKGARQFESYKKYIESIRGGNVEIIHFADDKKLKELYAECKGFIATAIDEDFGMTVVEAMAAGKPVVAPNEGGYKETVIDGITGKLINNIDVDKLVKAIKEIEGDPEKYKNACLERAKRFDTNNFINKIKKYLYET
ncbi:MAG: glycosyltransferase [bacterium]|nr:glycosyltransferase [bacterium]